MVSISGPWPEETATEFLQSTTVPLRLGCRTPSGAPWILSLWYRYRDGKFECATSAEADLVEFLDHDDTVAFEVSTNEPPYRGVRGNGQATVAPDEDKTVLRALLDRYLGETDSDLPARLLSPARAEVTITITPSRLASWDYSDRM